MWFECFFPDLSADRNESRVILGTGPLSEATHWKQTVIVLPQEQVVEKGEPIAFQLDITRDKEFNRRYVSSTLYLIGRYRCVVTLLLHSISD